MSISCHHVVGASVRVMSSAPPHPRTIVLFQDKCLSHRYIRSPDTSLVFERPQRLRAVKIGVSAAIARLHQCHIAQHANDERPHKIVSETDDSLSAALERLQISNSSALSNLPFIQTHLSDAVVDIMNHPAVKYIHGDIEGDVYLERLVNLIKESKEKISRGESEIPEGLSQGDLYRTSSFA